jgi:hypothetical protein
MSEDNNLETNELPAQLQDGESIIPHPLVDLYEQAVKEANENSDLSDESPIKISKPKEMPETDDNNVIGSSGTNRPGGPRKPAIKPNENGVISSGKADKINATKSTKPAKVDKRETVAVFSTRNVTWQGVGKVYRGYNIIDKADSEKWLTRDHIRLATPEEVKEEFGR